MFCRNYLAYTFGKNTVLWHHEITLDHYNSHCTITPAIIFIYFTLHTSNIYPCTSWTLHFFALLLCYNSQLLYIGIPPCIYFFRLLRPLHCCTVCLFVLYCIVLYILCKHTESHFTKSNSLFVQTYLANKT